MKDYLTELVREMPSGWQARNRVREYLQTRILEVLQREGAMRPLAFHGDTALRLLFQAPRYSEDLDFTLERPEAGYDLRRYLRAIQRALAAEGYEITLKVNDRKVVHNAFVRFRGLLHQLRLSAHSDEVLAVKVEVDTQPPAGAGLEITLVRRYVTLRLQHHDKPTLLAGKLHALLQRRYLKGRDVYDLIWFLSDPTWPPPNFTLLNNALRQTGWSGPDVGEANWRDVVWQRLSRASWRRVVEDVRPFLEREADVALLTRENLERVLKRSPRPS